MNAKITIHIYPRATKVNAAGLQPLYFRITINGQRKEFTTKKYINPKQWDAKSKLQEVERNMLNESELEKIINKEIQIERLDIIRDIFIFSCYTGLTYVDVKQLKNENLVKGIDGKN